jgi:hypothetical protein
LRLAFGAEGEGDIDGRSALPAEDIDLQGLGLAIPFLVASLAVERSLRFADRFKRWLPLVDKVAGAMLVSRVSRCLELRQRAQHVFSSPGMVVGRLWERTGLRG